MPDLASLVGAAGVERVLFAATVLAAAGLMWLAPRLPMTDLPQHAAQVALWRDLILGRSAWSNLVRINLFTPYLIGYGLTLPLSLVFTLAVAVRIVLTAALLGFVGGCMALRRALGGDPRLDWLFPVGFFGFAWQWGFLTFLVATPMALLFLFVVLKPAKAASLHHGALVVVSGVVLLFSHGLLFLAMLPLGGLLALWPKRRQGLAALGRALAPFVILTLLSLAFRLASAQAEGAMRFDGVRFGSDLWLKPIAMLVYVTNVDVAAAGIALPLTLLLLVSPLLLRARLNPGVAVLPFFGLFVLIMAMPSYAFQTALLFHRFALFLLPFYALMFRGPAPGDAKAPAWVMAAPILACWVVLGIQGSRIRAFAADAQPFETVLAAADPSKRALALVFDRASPVAANDTAYLHFPLWYQAEKGGFVDFNFAAFHPQIVRLKAGQIPDFASFQSWHPDGYDGVGAQAKLYDYLFVRGGRSEIDRLMVRSDCPLSIRAADSPWTLLERGACPAKPGS